jgi:hypothetical protein
VPAVFVSLYWAGLKDGFDGRLGRYVCTFTLFLVGYFLILALLRSHKDKASRPVRLGGRELTIFAQVTESSPETTSPRRWPRTDVHWEDLVTR